MKIVKHLNIYLIPGHLAFLKSYEPNQTYLAISSGIVRVLETNLQNDMTISDFENIEKALTYLNVGIEQKIGVLLNHRQIELFTFDNKQKAIRSIFKGGHSFERLQRSQLDFFYSLQRKNDLRISNPTLVFRSRNDKQPTKYDERLRIYGDVVLFPPNHYDLYHFLKRLEMDYIDGRFSKILKHD